MLSSEYMEFSKWLQGELDRRGWNQADLCRAARLSPALISRIMTGTRNPGPDACKAIAKALGYETEFVFRKAGLLTDKGKIDRRTATIAGMAEHLDDTDYDDLLSYIQFRLSKKKSR